MIETTYYPGVLAVNVTPVEPGITRVQTDILGAGVGDNRFHVGWLQEDRLVVQDDCVIVILQDGSTNYSDTITLLVDSGVPLDQICVEHRRNNHAKDSN